MLLLSLLSAISATTISLTFAPSPVILGATILFLTLEISMTFSLLMSSWFALLLFLIYVGGMLVMFSYFSAMSPNQTTSMTLLIATFFLIFLSLTSVLLSTSPSLTPLSLFPSHTMSTLSLFFYKNLPLLLFMTTLLFFMLILVVKLASRHAGPLRPFSPPPP